MSTLHFVDDNGLYLGGFGDGAKPPEGSIEVPAPSDGRMEWDGSEWQRTPVMDEEANAQVAHDALLDAITDPEVKAYLQAYPRG